MIYIYIYIICESEVIGDILFSISDYVLDCGQ